MLARRPHVLALCILFGLPGAARASETAAPPPPLRLAVYDLQEQGVDHRTSALVTEGLLSELRKLERLSVLGMNEVRAMLTHEMNKQLVGCDENDSCLTEIAGSLGVDQLVVGSLGRVGDSHVFSAKRIDAGEALTVGSATRRVPVVDGQEFLSLIEPVVAELFPERALRLGAVRGVNPEMVKLLKPPPLPRWVFFATGGLGLALAGGGGGAIWSANGKHAELNEKYASGVIDGADRNRLQGEIDDRYQVANRLLIASGATIAVLLVEALFTDWYGYRDWKPGKPIEF